MQSVYNGNTGNLFELIRQIKNSVGNSQNPVNFVNVMINSNPQFAEFVKEYEHTGIDGICTKYGIDSNLVREIARIM